MGEVLKWDQKIGLFEEENIERQAEKGLEEDLFLLYGSTFQKDKPIEDILKEVTTSSRINAELFKNVLLEFFQFEYCDDTFSEEDIIEFFHKLNDYIDEDFYIESEEGAYLIRVWEFDENFCTLYISDFVSKLNKWDSYQLNISLTDVSQTSKQLLEKSKLELVKLALLN